jgi:Tripartite tricarboxylate transporter TctB family
MKIRSPKDFWAGLFFIAIAGAFILLAQSYRMGTMHRMGPALFPTLVGVLLGVLGFAIAARGLVVVGPPVPRLHARPLIVSLLAIAAFGIALANFGLMAAIGALVALSSAASNESRPIEVVGLAIGLMVFSATVFVWVLGLPIPLWPGG